MDGTLLVLWGRCLCSDEVVQGHNKPCTTLCVTHSTPVIEGPTGCSQFINLQGLNDVLPVVGAMFDPHSYD